MRILLILFILLICGFLFLQGRLIERSNEKPTFLKEDFIAQNHQTIVHIFPESVYEPNEFETEVLRNDYANIWAHLNHLYQTNDVEAGKEYYTEDWFKQICANYEKPLNTGVVRLDSVHKLTIKTWSSDALVCNAIDSNVVLNYQYPNKKNIQKIANIGVALLFQGDHWCVDAIKILDEKIVNPKK